MNTIGHAVILVVGLTALALGGLTVVRRLLKQEMLETNLSAAEAMLGVVGTLFSVLLGFLVAGAIDRYSDAQTHAEQEANGIAAIFRISRGFSDEDRPRLRQLCREYSKQVTDVEWGQMERRETINHGWEPYQKLWEGVVAVVPENDRQSNLQQSLTPAMQSVGEHRRARLIAAQYQMSGALWIVIGFGALITIAFTYVFASQFRGVQDLMTGLVAASLALNIWLLSAYSSPFSGELQIQPKMFNMLKDNVFNVPDTPSRYLHDPKS